VIDLILLPPLDDGLKVIEVLEVIIELHEIREQHLQFEPKGLDVGMLCVLLRPVFLVKDDLVDEKHEDLLAILS
jgi:hypothetical protein